MRYQISLSRVAATLLLCVLSMTPMSGQPRFFKANSLHARLCLYPDALAFGDALQPADLEYAECWLGNDTIFDDRPCVMLWGQYEGKEKQFLGYIYEDPDGYVWRYETSSLYIDEQQLPHFSGLNKWVFLYDFSRSDWKAGDTIEWGTYTDFSSHVASRIISVDHVKLLTGEKLPRITLNCGMVYGLGTLGRLFEGTQEGAWSKESCNLELWKDGQLIYTEEKPAGRAVTNVTLTADHLYLTEGETKKLKAKVTPDDAMNMEVSWSSSDERVATVDGDGTVTATGEGTCTITVKTDDGGKSARCEVTVFAKAEPGTFLPCGTKMIIHKTDGESVTYYANEINCIEFIEEPVHECVDLGLSSGIQWATSNVGADSPEDFGDYFAWGETDPQSDNSYSWPSYKWCDGSNSTMTKYCTVSSFGTVDDRTVLEGEDDVAHVKWGGNWRMPTTEEVRELMEECNWTWTQRNGVKGYLVSSRQPGNSNSIFLPAAGMRYEGRVKGYGSFGYYWTGSLYSNPPYRNDDTAFFFFLSSSSFEVWNYNRSLGLRVRPVCNK